MRPLSVLALCGIVATSACDSTNPFDDTDTDTATSTDTGTGTTTGSGDQFGDEGTGDTGSSFVVSGTPPAGVTGPAATSDESIVRFEERNADGGGYAEEFSYDAVNNLFTIDNLAFDGEGPYQQDNQVPNLGPNGAYAVYEAAVTVPDFLDGDPIGQITPYRAVLGVSTNNGDNGDPRSSFAIVRTGGYVQYGFGGFVYQRNGDTVFPSNGQAIFNGDYAGVMIFNGVGGMLYTQGDMELALDFDDPTDGFAGVRGRVFNREAFNLDGSSANFDADGTVEDATDLPLTDIRFVLDGDNGNMSATGELSGDVFSTFRDEEGVIQPYQSGTYYGILAGDTTDAADGGEIVGVMVLTATDPREALNGATSQETGGFILYRDP